MLNACHCVSTPLRFSVNQHEVSLCNFSAEISLGCAISTMPHEDHKTQACRAGGGDDAAAELEAHTMVFESRITTFSHDS